jgi:hypothetical protein
MSGSTRQTRSRQPDIVEADAVLDLVRAWLAAINNCELRAMIDAQKQLRADHDVSICLMNRHKSRRADQ